MLKPTSLTSNSAASLPLVFLTAATCLSPPYTIFPSLPSERPTIVVLGGSSAVGLYTIQYAVLKLNLKVIATCSTRNIDFVRSMGADQVLDYTELTSTSTLASKLAQLKPIEGFLSIIDCVGGPPSDLPSLLSPRSPASKTGGAYITIVGDKTNRLSLGGWTSYIWNPRMIVRYFWGWWGSAPRYLCVDLRLESGVLECIGELLEKGMKTPIDEVFKFEEVEKAYEKLMKGKCRGKVVVVVAGDP